MPRVVITGSEMSLNFIIWIQGLESRGIFVQEMENRMRICAEKQTDVIAITHPTQCVDKIQASRTE